MIDSKGLTIYRMTPREVEQFLSAKYGDKLVAVNALKLAKQNQKRVNYGQGFRESTY
ncbi:MAG: hypothetical protein P4N59_04585 [Negativicutes bacterium]|nr:hypothetical protein [Negativicutes bacterium]